MTPEKPINYIEYIKELEITPEQKVALIAYVQTIERQRDEFEFKYLRTLKDRSITNQLLNSSIQDLEQKQKYIEETNNMLEQRKEEIEKKNKELARQKTLILEKSEHLKENLKALEHSYGELEQFSYIASHDLKSPLRTISNFAQLLEKRYADKLDEGAKEFIQFIVSGTRHMSNIINDLLEYSKVGRNEENFSFTDFNDLLDIVRFNLSEAIKESNAKIHAHELPTLKVNKLSVIQLFQNLIGNAIKFRREQVAPVVEIGCNKDSEEEVVFYIKDNGVGMDEGFMNKAFLPFQRINNREREGTGIGLAICKKVIDLHEGRLWYKRNPQHGTTFFFSIPTLEKRKTRQSKNTIVSKMSAV